MCARERLVVNVDGAGAPGGKSARGLAFLAWSCLDGSNDGGVVGA